MEARILARARRLLGFPDIVRGYFKTAGLETLTA